jgi:hypothetical protein
MLSYVVELVGVAALRAIDGIPHSIWTYSITWRDPPPSGTTPVDPGVRIGLEFSARSGILDPRSVPDILAVQATTLEVPLGKGVQRVSRDLQDRQGHTLTLAFVAPSASDPLSGVRLAKRASVGSEWANVPFAVSEGSPAGLQQVLPGPASYDAGQPASNVLTHSARSITKSTVGSFLTPPATFDLASSGGAAFALAKHRFARQLLLQPGEVDAVRSTPETLLDATSAQLLSSAPWDVLKLFEGTGRRLPALAALASTPLDVLRAVGNAMTAHRRNASTPLPTPSHPASPSPSPVAVDASGKGLGTRNVALARAAALATRGLLQNTLERGVLPIGSMNLERLEMAPAGIVRGELIATIPLAPLEETAVVQKEWSVTSKEFTSIVTDSLENVSETGVTDNTELAQSTSSQNQHSNQFNITGTVSGGVDQIFDASASTGFTAQDASSASATASTKHSSSLTQKASARVKKEHKVTISTTTVTGSSESTTRSLKNSDPVNPIRIDYFRLMREWRVRLYRYGLRLTYDLMIAEPAGALRLTHAYLAWLRSQLGPFQFNVPHFPSGYVRSVADANYAQILQLADNYGAQLPPFPDPGAPIGTVKQLTKSGSAGDIMDDHTDPINVPDGFWIDKLWLNIRLRNVGARVRVLFSTLPEQKCDDPSGVNIGPLDLTQFDLGKRVGGTFSVYTSSHDAMNSFIEVTAVFAPTDATVDKWLADAWQALFDAAQNQYFQKQQDFAGRIAKLEDRLFNVDTLTLRREESDEIMKQAMTALVGSSTSSFWNNQEALAWLANQKEILSKTWPPIKDPLVPFMPGISVDPRPLGAAFTRISDSEVFPLLPSVDQNEVVVRFINQAIEWENVVTFLYSYCWDTPESWEFVRNLQHADPTRQAFLRAGSARIVLTVRKGWEQMWNAFVQTGIPYYQNPNDPQGNPIAYMTIAQEIAAYDDRNYPGIPPANPSQSAVRLEDAVYTTASTVLTPQPGQPLVNQQIEVESNLGFLVGAQIVIDSGVGDAFPANSPGRQESTTIVGIAAGDTRHIVVAQVQNPHGGNGDAYAVVQPGTRGVLIAEWNEYTPTSGTDIAVTSNLATIQ